MTMIQKKKRRLSTILMAAAALGSSSATLSGALAVIALQNPAADSRAA
jgi:hypothetical protein